MERDPSAAATGGGYATGDASSFSSSLAWTLSAAPFDCTPNTAVAATPEAASRVLYEDAELLAVDKPAGLVTHPAYKHPDGTLCDAIFARQAARGEGRPWLLHRLDRETSGVVLFAKTERARRAIVRQFERRSVGKRYLALLASVPERLAGVIDASLARDPADRRRVVVDPTGQPAATRYRVLAATPAGYALALAEPLTGRTHQIRAHFTSVGAPLVGDRLYLPPEHADAIPCGRAMLHAWQLTIHYPGTGEPFTVTAPSPPDLLATAAWLGLAGPLGALLSHPFDPS